MQRLQIVWIGFVLLLVSCQAGEAEPKDRAAVIASLEQRMKSQRGPGTLDSLLVFYEQDFSDSTNSDNMRFERLRYLVEAAYADGRFLEAYDRLLAGLNEFPEAASVPQAGLLLAEIAIQRLNEPETAVLIFEQLRARFPGHPTLQNIPAAYDSIGVDAYRLQLQSKVYPRSGFDKVAAKKYGRAMLAATALSIDADTVIKDHLASGAVLEEAGQYPLALRHYDIGLARFANHPKAGNLAFMKGFVLKEMQGKTAEGDAALQQFIDTYPQHNMVNDARQLMSAQTE